MTLTVKIMIKEKLTLEKESRLMKAINDLITIEFSMEGYPENYVGCFGYQLKNEIKND